MDKVMLMGLDGATWDIIRLLVQEGQLPTLAHLMDVGASGILQSTIPPVTPAAWTTVFTGKNPGKHGIYDFQKLDPQTYQFSTVRTDQHREKTIWDLLGEHERRSIVVDVPFTYPPRPLNGIMLTGYGTPRTPDTTFTYPADLAARVPPSLRSEIRVALPSHRFERSPKFIEEWQAIMAGRRRLLHHFVREPWDFFMVVFSITDNMAHVFWTYVDPAHPNYHRPEAEEYRRAFFDAYRQCDRLLGELMQAAGSEVTTLVISDHGFGSVRPRQYIFDRLLQGGYVAAKNSSSGRPFQDRLMKLAVRTYTRFPALREWAKNLRPGRRKMLIKSLGRAGVLPGSDNLDHGRSRLIPTNFGLRMWVNDRQRFAQGLVPADGKEALLDEVSEYLLSDRDPVTGKPTISVTYRGSDVYHGPHAELAPDLVIEYRNSYDPYQADPPLNAHIEGGHTLGGILLAHGPGIRRTAVEGSRLVDLAPTALHLLGHPIPPDMDGRVLTELFSGDYLRSHPVTRSDKPAKRVKPAPDRHYSDEQDAELREQLRQLGYL